MLEMITAGIIGLYAAGLIYDRYEIHKNRLVTSGQQEAMVLVNLSPLEEFKQLPFIGYRASISKLLTSLGIKAAWKYSATSEDLEEAINNPSYQSIVLMGHGSKTNWDAKDGPVSSKMVAKMSNGNLKDGYWLQYTCGSDEEGLPLGHVVMKDKSKIRGYNKKVNGFDMQFEKPITIN